MWLEQLYHSSLNSHGFIGKFVPSKSQVHGVCLVQARVPIVACLKRGKFGTKVGRFGLGNILQVLTLATRHQSQSSV
jgi:hypothetical protein